MNSKHTPPSAPAGLRVLIVEDEVLIRMLFEDMLDELGHKVEAAAGNIEDAVRLARGAACDIAILDVHLNGIKVYPAADILEERGIPFIFATGLSDGTLLEKFRGRPTIQKPFQPDVLQKMLAQATAGPR